MFPAWVRNANNPSAYIDLHGDPGSETAFRKPEMLATQAPTRYRHASYLPEVELTFELERAMNGRTHVRGIPASMHHT